MAETDAESVRTESQGGDDLYLSELSTEQLRGLTRDTRDAVSTLKAETEMFEKFYKRLDPKDLAPAAVPEVGAPPLDFTQMRSRRRSKSRSTISERLLSLSVDQKCELVQRELENSKEEAQSDADNTERILQSFKAMMEEAEIRSSEIKKAMYEFERDIGRAAMSRKKSAGVTPEKILRYMEEKTRARDSLVDKLRLKNASLKIQKKKLQLQLKQKKLHNTMAESEHLAKEISVRKEMLQRIELETELVEQERSKAESLNKKLRTQLSDYRVPEVLHYVHEKMEQEELEKNIRAWERKVEIAELSLRTQRRSWEQIKAANRTLS
ncbi:cilia- and flagella-associated protein 263 isoform X2 [Mixophyes fleayi]|uniref:cilia- and flagella-associated protein 263 isoform X2 n=1 Tax=Mixophyes fleayi TaxID=3061075 RepID=UPI003F4E3279